MGYRSEVQSVIYGNKENLNAYLTTCLYITNYVSLKEFRDNLRRYVVYDSDMHILHLYLGDVKWYEGYPEVETWEAFMRESESMGLHYEFVRIGEDNGDMYEERSKNSVNLLFVSSPIIIPEFEMNLPIPLLPSLEEGVAT